MQRYCPKCRTSFPTAEPVCPNCPEPLPFVALAGIVAVLALGALDSWLIWLF